MRLAGLVLLLLMTPAAVDSPGDPAVAMLLPAEAALLDMTNAERLANGLSPLAFDLETLPIARARATTQLGLAAPTHYDAGGNLIFTRLLSEAHIAHDLVGENLASAAFYTPAVPLVAERAMMASESHRKNILEPQFTRVAVGVASDAQGQFAVAEIYR